MAELLLARTNNNVEIVLGHGRLFGKWVFLISAEIQLSFCQIVDVFREVTSLERKLFNRMCPGYARIHPHAWGVIQSKEPL